MQQDTNIPEGGATDLLPLSDAELSALASIIVYDSGCQPKHDADTVALALVRLAYGVATSAALYVQQNPFNQKPSDVASDAAGDAAIHVALGCFRRTHAHGTALEGFMELARRFDVRAATLGERPSVTEWLAELFKGETKGGAQ